MIQEEYRENVMTAELHTPRRVMRAESKAGMPGTRMTKCLESLVNQYTYWYPESFDRFTEGAWLDKTDFKKQFPEIYAQLLAEIKERAKWIDDNNRIAKHGILSHSTMTNAIKAVFA
ncbi:MAG: hypothetical protein ACI8T6_000455 [Candidatus Poseidoniaceae archaeon]|jgi:hypothetical protein